MDRVLYYRKMHILLKELGIESAKTDLLEGYGVGHTFDLKDADLFHLVQRLIQMKEARFSHQEDDIRQWRSNVLALCNKYGIYVTNDDWRAINHLLLNKKIAGKLLYEMNIKELQQTCIRLRIILAKRQEIQSQERTLARQN